MVINNVRALLLITYRISLQYHVRVFICNRIQKTPTYELLVFSFGHEEKPLEQKNQLDQLPTDSTGGHRQPLQYLLFQPVQLHA